MLHIVRRAVGLLMMTAPFAVAYRQAVADLHQFAESLGQMLPLLHQPIPLEVELLPVLEPDSASPLLTPEETLAPSPSAPPAHSPFQKSQTARPKNAKVIMISDRTVLRLAQSGSVPLVRAVQATPEHPAGLQLSGVSALGIGVEDGDVLMEVSGVPVGSRSQVAELVIAARSRHLHSMSARLWRRGEVIALVVALPYLDSSGKLAH